MKDLLVYTAIFGGRDVVRAPYADRFDWRCLTDSRELADMPGIVYMEPPVAGDPVRSARMVKTHPHTLFPEYKRWIWMDGNVGIRDGVTEEQLCQIPGPLAVPTHPHRDCLYHEAWVCIDRDLDDPRLITKQMLIYLERGYPAKAGLGETGVLVRDNTPEINAFCDFWWREIVYGSRRDQLSFNYAAWRLKQSLQYMSTLMESEYFVIDHHAQVAKPYPGKGTIS